MTGLLQRPSAAPTRPPGRATSHLLATAFAGLTGSVAVTVAAASQGARAFAPGQQVLTHTPGDSRRLLYFGGAALLAGTWLVVLRQVRRGAWTVRSMQVTGWLWALPLLAAVPVASRDLWAYAGQGDVLAHGLDPYHVGPAALHDEFSRQVAVPWRHSPAPYGPLWLQLSRLVVVASNGHPLQAALALRLFAAFGLVLVSVTLPRITAAAGGDPACAVALVCLNPLVLVISLGGGHNDLLMVGLIAAGLWLACRPGPAWLNLGAAAVVTTAAAAVKLPAVIALAFLPLVWARYADPGRGRRPVLWPAALVVAVVAAAAAGLITLLTGLPHGWFVHLNTDTAGALWLSLPVAALLIAKYLRGDTNDRLTLITGHNHEVLQRCALVGAAVLLPVLWFVGRRREPMRWLAAALLAGVLLSTTVLPWYACWPLIAFAATPLAGRWLAPLAGASIGLALAVQPDGVYVLHRLTAVPIIAVAGVVCLIALGRPEPVIGSRTPAG